MILKDRMDEVGDFYYKRGAINSVRALNQLRRKSRGGEGDEGGDSEALGQAHPQSVP